MATLSISPASRLIAAACFSLISCNGAVAGTTAGPSDLIVTARRVAEPLQTTPIAVTALSASQRLERGVFDLRDLADVAPSLTLAVGGWRNATGFAMRGQTTGLYTGGAPAVQVYVAGAPIMEAGRVQPFYDLAQIEVLRGPQGTLFGRGSNGGAILFEPVRPGVAFSGEAATRLGDHGRRDLTLAFTAPLVADQLSLRVAAQRIRRDGFTTNLSGGAALDGEGVDSIRAGLSWTPTSWLSEYVLVEHTDQTQSAGSALLYGRPRPCGFGPAGVSGLASCVYGPALGAITFGQLTYGALQAARPDFAAYPNGLQDAYAQQLALGARQVRASAHGLSQGERSQSDRLLSETRLIGQAVSAKLVFSYQRAWSRTGVDQDGTVFPILDNVISTAIASGDQLSRRNLTGEAQLSGAVGPASWVVGAFGQSIRPEPMTELTYLLMAAINPQVSNLTNGEHSLSRALFGQANIDLGGWVHGLRAVVGLRQSWDEVRTESHRFGQAYSIFTDAAGPAACAEPTSAAYGAPYSLTGCSGPSASNQSQGLNWNLGLDYAPGADTLVYIASRHGYRGAGINGSISVPALQRFSAEGLTDLEVGLKADRHLGAALVRLDVAAYRAWMTDAQRQVFVTDPATGQLATITADAARAHVTGLEAELGVSLPSGLRMRATSTLTEAMYDRFDIPVAIGTSAVTTRDGRNQAFANTPRLVLAVEANLPLFASDRLGRMDLGIHYHQRSALAFSDLPADEPEGMAPAYDTVDMDLNWQWNPRLSGQVFVRNLTDAVYVIGGQSLQSQLGFTVASYGEPRMIGAELRYAFGAL